jgi:hypothetical protein
MKGSLVRVRPSACPRNLCASGGFAVSGGPCCEGFTADSGGVLGALVPHAADRRPRDRAVHWPADASRTPSQEAASAQPFRWLTGPSAAAHTDLRAASHDGRRRRRRVACRGPPAVVFRGSCSRVDDGQAVPRLGSHRSERCDASVLSAGLTSARAEAEALQSTRSSDPTPDNLPISGVDFVRARWSPTRTENATRRRSGR